MLALKTLTVITVLSPLVGSLIAGLFAKRIGPKGAHWVTIAFMTLSLLSAILIADRVILRDEQFYGALYSWGTSGSFHFDIGFMVDNLTAIMMLAVIFVSLLVHIYSIGYMANDPGYQRFFSYMSLFTFSMLLLVSANNFFQLFFGWEGVGLVSYLLIGFWFDRETAAAGSLKAFLINRVGDVGFILGVAAILDYCGTLDYHTVFGLAGSLNHPTITFICILLFVGAMGKSAQMPLHVWLPESMEGPTPISALIHAATMVTAGVFMVARLSPLFELSTTALSTVLIIGSTTALFTGLLALVEFDIKRVIAFSTMSQLGYMMAANGASFYAGGIFHLLTHACFKALLFLAAGSVIIALHHTQDMRQMGGLRKQLPITYLLFLIGALALTAIPPFSGFYSKDSIIDAVQHAQIPGANYAYICLLLGAFVTGFYIFRAFFMVFHGRSRLHQSTQASIMETPWNMRGPMLILAVPSIILGMLLFSPLLLRSPGLLGAGLLDNSITVLSHHETGPINSMIAMTVDSVKTLPFWFSILGVIGAWVAIIGLPKIPVYLQKLFPALHRVLVNRYGFDTFNWLVFVRGGRWLSHFFYRVTDVKMLDDFLVDGSGRNATRISRLLRRLQSGYLYHYVLIMILSVLIFLIWLVLI